MCCHTAIAVSGCKCSLRLSLPGELSSVLSSTCSTFSSASPRAAAASSLVVDEETLFDRSLLCLPDDNIWRSKYMHYRQFSLCFLFMYQQLRAFASQPERTSRIVSLQFHSCRGGWALDSVVLELHNRCVWPSLHSEPWISSRQISRRTLNPDPCNTDRNNLISYSLFMIMMQQNDNLISTGEGTLQTRPKQAIFFI